MTEIKCHSVRCQLRQPRQADVNRHSLFRATGNSLVVCTESFWTNHPKYTYDIRPGVTYRCTRFSRPCRCAQVVRRWQLRMRCDTPKRKNTCCEYKQTNVVQRHASIFYYAARFKCNRPKEKNPPLVLAYSPAAADLTTLF